MRLEAASTTTVLTKNKDELLFFSVRAIVTNSLARIYCWLTLVFVTTGCIIGEGSISDRIPKGRIIPMEQVPEIVLPDADRAKLPDGTTIEHCEGDVFRFNYPDGTIWFRNSKGEDCGGVI